MAAAAQLSALYPQYEVEITDRLEALSIRCGLLDCFGATELAAGTYDRVIGLEWCLEQFLRSRPRFTPA